MVRGISQSNRTLLGHQVFQQVIEVPAYPFAFGFDADFGAAVLVVMLLQVVQRRACGFAAGVAADHAAALFPAALAFDLVVGRTVLGHTPGHALRPLCPLKNSQSVKPAALAIAFTLRAICDSDSPKTFSLLATPAGRMASRAALRRG